MKRDLGDGYELDDDPARIDREAAHRYLTQSYWAGGRPREVQDALIEGAARVVGLYHDGDQVGFSRTLGRIQPVVSRGRVRPRRASRARSRSRARAFLGRRGPLAETKWLLHTRDAHDLYRKFGFVEPDERALERRVTS